MRTSPPARGDVAGIREFADRHLVPGIDEVSGTHVPPMCPAPMIPILIGSSFCADLCSQDNRESEGPIPF
jgi:hypothetical protein